MTPLILGTFFGNLATVGGPVFAVMTKFVLELVKSFLAGLMPVLDALMPVLGQLLTALLPLLPVFGQLLAAAARRGMNCTYVVSHVRRG